jgi:hypothetical protein
VKLYVIIKPCHSHVSFVAAKTEVFLTMEKKIPLLFTGNNNQSSLLYSKNNRHK